MIKIVRLKQVFPATYPMRHKLVPAVHEAELAEAGLAGCDVQVTAGAARHDREGAAVVAGRA